MMPARAAVPFPNQPPPPLIEVVPVHVAAANDNQPTYRPVSCGSAFTLASGCLLLGFGIAGLRGVGPLSLKRVWGQAPAAFCVLAGTSMTALALGYMCFSLNYRPARPPAPRTARLNDAPARAQDAPAPRPRLSGPPALVEHPDGSLELAARTVQAPRVRSPR